MSERQWTIEECSRLIRMICCKAGVVGVQVIKNKRLNFGTCRYGWDEDNKLVRPKIFLAEHMWTGEYTASRGFIKKVTTVMTSPEMRMLTSIHEATHMVVASQQGNRVAAPHGKDFQAMEWALCRESGWTSVYKRCPGYAKMFTNMETGEIFQYPGG